MHSTSEIAAKQYYSTAKTSCDTHANAKSSSKINQSKNSADSVRLFRPKYTTISRLPSCTSLRGGGAQPRNSKSGVVCMVELKLKVQESKLKGLEHPISGNNRRLKSNRACMLVTLWRGSLLAPSINRNKSSPRARFAQRDSLLPLARWDSRARLGGLGSNRS